MTWLEFRQNHPEFKHLPEFIRGQRGRKVALLDATIDDIQAYAKRLTFIAKAKRNARRRRLGQ